MIVNWCLTNLDVSQVPFAPEAASAITISSTRIVGEYRLDMTGGNVEHSNAQKQHQRQEAKSFYMLPWWKWRRRLCSFLAPNVVQTESLIDVLQSNLRSILAMPIPRPVIEHCVSRSESSVARTWLSRMEKSLITFSWLSSWAFQSLSSTNAIQEGIQWPSLAVSTSLLIQPAFVFWSIVAGFGGLAKDDGELQVRSHVPTYTALSSCVTV